MILVLLGTQPLPFTRLIEQLITLHQAGQFINQKIMIQAGATPVDYPDFEVFSLIEKSRLQQLIDEADLVITHGGAGSMFELLAKQKKIIVMARRAEFGEHVDDHQLELVDMLFAQQHLIACPTLQESFACLPDFPFKPYIANPTQILQQIKSWIDEI